MLSKSKWLILGYLAGIIVISMIFIPFLSKNCNPHPFSTISNYFPLSSAESTEILIDSNDDFVSLECPGNGTVSNPYRLENRFVNVTGDYGIGIHVVSTSAHFVIQNCTIYSTFVGIFCEDIQVGSAIIRNNTCQSTAMDGGGIVFDSSKNSQIVNNTCCDFMQGIHFNYVQDCLIENNTFLRNKYQGINIRYSSSNQIINNTIQDTQQFGIVIVGRTSSYNSVYHNCLINNSIAEEYDIDGERFGTITSQGYDEGVHNMWYNESLKEGNRWSDYSGSGSYSIDGPSGFMDIYPFGRANSSQTYTTNTISGYPITLLIIGFSFILSNIIISRRLNKRPSFFEQNI